MKMNHNTFIICCIQALVAAVLFMSTPVAFAQDSTSSSSVAPTPTVAIVVHKDAPVDNLTLDNLRSIFLANQQFWENRTRISLLVRAPQSQERDFVLERVYHMSEAQFRQYWIAKMFRAEVPRGPKIVLSTDMTLDLVVAIPGSISFINADAVTAAVKVVKIDGLLPTDEGYPLK